MIENCFGKQSLEDTEILGWKYKKKKAKKGRGGSIIENADFSRSQFLRNKLKNKSYF